MKTNTHCTLELCSSFKNIPIQLIKLKKKIWKSSLEKFVGICCHICHYVLWRISHRNLYRSEGVTSERYWRLVPTTRPATTFSLPSPSQSRGSGGYQSSLLFSITSPRTGFPKFDNFPIWNEANQCELQRFECVQNSARGRMDFSRSWIDLFSYFSQLNLWNHQKHAAKIQYQPR